MKRYFMICIENRGYEASLEIRKIYEVLSDRVAEKHHQIRVIDESGEDYLCPARHFRNNYFEFKVSSTRFSSL